MHSLKPPRLRALYAGGTIPTDIKLLRYGNLISTVDSTVDLFHYLC